VAKTGESGTAAPAQGAGRRVETAFDSWWISEQRGWASQRDQMNAPPRHEVRNEPAARASGKLAETWRETVDQARAAHLETIDALRQRTRRRLEAAQEELAASDNAASAEELRRQTAYGRERLAKALSLFEHDLDDLRGELLHHLAKLDGLADEGGEE